MACIGAGALEGPRRRGAGGRGAGGRLGPALLGLVLAGEASAQEAAPGWPEMAALFEERCVMCHSGVHAALGLHLDSREGALAGSRDGPVLVPGDPEGSELVRRLRGTSLPRMPFLSYPLEEEEIALVESWIAAGLPEDGAAEAPGASAGKAVRGSE